MLDECVLSLEAFQMKVDVVFLEGSKLPPAVHSQAIQHIQNRLNIWKQTNNACLFLAEDQQNVNDGQQETCLKVDKQPTCKIEVKINDDDESRPDYTENISAAFKKIDVKIGAEANNECSEIITKRVSNDEAGLDENPDVVFDSPLAKQRFVVHTSIKGKPKMRRQRKKKTKTTSVLSRSGEEDGYSDGGNGEELRMQKSYNKPMKHIPGEVFHCDECQKVLKTSKGFAEHMENHKTGPMTCPQCQQILHSKSSYYMHVKMHKTKLKCPECSYHSGMQVWLDRHIAAVHRKDKKYLCDKCPRGFCTPYVLKRHSQALHALGDLLTCKDCDYTTRTNDSLRRHMLNRHTANRPSWICDLCGHIFTAKKILEDHRRLHMGEKRYKCGKCDTLFASRSSKNRHVQVVHGDKKFPCSDCGKPFSDISSLRRHSVIHTGEKNFVCNFCSYRCNTRSNLRKHWRVVHKRADYDNRQNSVVRLYKKDTKNGEIDGDSKQATITEKVYDDLSDSIKDGGVVLDEMGSNVVSRYTVVSMPCAPSESDITLNHQTQQLKVITMPMEYSSDQSKEVPISMEYQVGQSKEVLIQTEYQMEQCDEVSETTEYPASHSREVTISTEYPTGHPKEVLTSTEYTTQHPKVSISKVLEYQDQQSIMRPGVDYQSEVSVSVSQPPAPVGYPAESVVIWTEGVVHSGYEAPTSVQYRSEAQISAQFGTSEETCVEYRTESEISTEYRTEAQTDTEYRTEVQTETEDRMEEQTDTEYRTNVQTSAEYTTLRNWSEM